MIGILLSYYVGILATTSHVKWLRPLPDVDIVEALLSDVAQIELSGYCFTGSAGEDENPIIVRKSDYASFLNLIRNRRYRAFLGSRDYRQETVLESKISVRLKNGETWSEAFGTHLARDVFGIEAYQVLGSYLAYSPASASWWSEEVPYVGPTLPRESLLRLNKIDQDGIVSVVIGGAARPTRSKNVLLGLNAYDAAKIGQFVSAVELSSRTSRKPIVPDSYLEFRSVWGERFRFDFSKKRIREDAGYFLESLLKE
jgi:hypothetical protein